MFPQGSRNYPYVFERTDKLPKTLSDLHVGGIYVWDTQAMIFICDVPGTLININPLKNDASSPGLWMDIGAVDAAVLADFDYKQSTATDVDADEEVTSVEIPGSHTNVDAVGSYLTVSADAISDEPHLIEVRFDVPVELDGDDSRGKSITTNKFDNTN